MRLRLRLSPSSSHHLAVFDMFEIKIFDLESGNLVHTVTSALRHLTFVIPLQWEEGKLFFEFDSDNPVPYLGCYDSKRGGHTEIPAIKLDNSEDFLHFDSTGMVKITTWFDGAQRGVKGLLYNFWPA